MHYLPPFYFKTKVWCHIIVLFCQVTNKVYLAGGSLRVCEMIDRTGLPLSPVYEKINQKKKYVKFINKINIFIINKMHNTNFAQGLQIFQDDSLSQPISKKFRD